MNMPYKILAIDSNHECLNTGLRDAGFIVDEDYTSSKEIIEQKIADYDGMIVRSRFPIDKDFLTKATNLKFIGRVGAGLENIDEDFAANRGIILFNSPEGNRDSVGEHAIGMLLILMHHLRRADNEVRNGIWKREENRGDELKGKTVGIIGYGNMGNAFAKRLQGFDVDVICYDILPNKSNQYATQVSLTEFFQRAEVVSLHTPQTPETSKMINAEFIANFQHSFYFVNTARGKSVVTKDLVEAMKSGKILGAALDVLEFEKSSFEKLIVSELPDEFQYLIQADNVVLAPHIAGWTHQSKIKLAEFIKDKIIVWSKAN
ncbi:D-3-phosphoglycerate dehydrogenase [Algoriella xinjiangensis]|uniref:D-3-phosphoglycerate dehydrogenase n=1 Tax=Algoriella xinjiangensis TaxID=684065 RepID=A0A1I4YH83_9FLAO|nr:2-hydroxyacid dehydrogenase [Algoriella xinjiangensis]SFN37401.1 D-3-phosphoglycerate dehydrogenase [Algoriella xinjiangensis]VDH17346.1 D-3-phosphoglycerate dehydrogenase [Algoriella xinjiangensis]